MIRRGYDLSRCLALHFFSEAVLKVTPNILSLHCKSGRRVLTRITYRIIKEVPQKKSDLTYYQFHCHTSCWYLAGAAGEGGYDSTTCSQQSYLLGRRQKVIAFTYFKPRAVAGASGLNSRKYVEGILGNLEAIVLIYGPEWTMRLYHNLGENDIEELLPFTAREKQFVLCDINRNPLLGKISWSKACWD